MSFKRILLVKPKGKKGLGFSADVIPLGLEYVEPRTIDADLDELMDSFNDFSSFNPMNYISLLKQAWNINGILNTVRLGTALTTDLGDSYLEDKLMVIK
jgi:hypothetical protein